MKELFHFVGKAFVVESQDEAVFEILSKHVKPGDIVVIQYEGPRAAPACRKCCTPPRT